MAICVIVIVVSGSTGQPETNSSLLKYVKAYNDKDMCLLGHAEDKKKFEL